MMISQKYPNIELLQKEIRCTAPIFRKVIKKQYDLFGEDWATQFEDALASYGVSLKDGFQSPVQAYNEFSLEAMRLQINFDKNQVYNKITYEEASISVYNNYHYMIKTYLPALFLTHFLWPHHYQFKRWVSRKFFSKLAKVKKICFCDVGIGTGFYSAELLSNFSGAIGYGFDISDASIFHTKMLLKSQNLNGRYTCKKRFVEKLNGVDFNAFMCVELLEHLEDPQNFLINLANTVSSGSLGLISAAVNAPNRDHIYLYRSNDDVKEQLLNAGFQVEDEVGLVAYETGLFTETVPSSACFVVRKK